jgi:hypothetical protein
MMDCLATDTVGSVTFPGCALATLAGQALGGGKVQEAGAG